MGSEPAVPPRGPGPREQAPGAARPFPGPPTLRVMIEGIAVGLLLGYVIREWFLPTIVRIYHLG